MASRANKYQVDFSSIEAEVVAFLKVWRARHGNGDDCKRLPSKAIARRFGIRPHSNHESRKRGVRDLVKHLRAKGHPVLADFAGYYWGATIADHQRYQRRRRRAGLSHLSAASRDSQSPAAHDAAGQLCLFGPTPEQVFRY